MVFRVVAHLCHNSTSSCTLSLFSNKIETGRGYGKNAAKWMLELKVSNVISMTCRFSRKKAAVGRIEQTDTVRELRRMVKIQTECQQFYSETAAIAENEGEWQKLC